MPKKLKHIIDTDAQPTIPSGFTIDSHKGMGKMDVSDIKLYLKPEQEKGYIKGTELQKKLEDKSPLNATVLDYLLAHSELIPEEWKGKYVFFWGTIFRHSDGDLYVRYLYFRDGEWTWDSGWLDDGFSGLDPAALHASRSQSSEPKHSSDTLTLADLEKRVTELEKYLFNNK